jgi:hypothetical protein
MPTLAGIATVGFGTAAYYAPTYFQRNSMIASAVLAASIVPVTIVFILPTVRKLQGILARKDEVAAKEEGDGLLDKWQKLNLIRWGLMAIGGLIAWKSVSTISDVLVHVYSD